MVGTNPQGAQSLGQSLTLAMLCKDRLLFSGVCSPLISSVPASTDWPPAKTEWKHKRFLFCFRKCMKMSSARTWLDHRGKNSFNLPLKKKKKKLTTSVITMSPMSDVLMEEILHQTPFQISKTKRLWNSPYQPAGWIFLKPITGRA